MGKVDIYAPIKEAVSKPVLSKGEIGEQILSQNNIVEQLECITEDLRSMLGPVLSKDDNDYDVVSKPSDMNTKTDLGCALLSNNYRINSVIRRINELIKVSGL